MARRGHGEGAVFFEESRQRWVGVVDLGRGIDGKRQRQKVTGKTKAAVLKRLRELQADADAGTTTPGDLTVGVFLDRWITQVVPARSSVKSRNTLDNYRWALGHIRPALGTRRLRALTAEDVDDLLHALADRGMARNSVMRVRSVLATALKHAQRRRLVVVNVAELAEIPATARAAKEGRSLTEDEAKALLAAAASDRVGPLVVVGLMLGLRPGELCGLRWSDVDLDATPPLLHVRQARKREIDHDGREVLTFGDPKTKKSRRSIVLPAPAVDALRRQKAAQASERLLVGEAWADIDLVFATEIGTPIDPSNLRRSFSRLTTRAGLGHWTPRELRHSAASLLSAAGVPLEEAMDLLGHVDTRMLERVYRHRIRPAVAAAAAPMEAMFGGA